MTLENQGALIAINPAFNALEATIDKLGNLNVNGNIESLLQHQSNQDYLLDYMFGEMPSIQNVDCGAYKAQMRNCYSSLAVCLAGAAATGPWFGVVGSLCALDFGLCFDATGAAHPNCRGSLTGYGIAPFSDDHFVNSGFYNNICD